MRNVDVKGHPPQSQELSSDCQDALTVPSTEPPKGPDPPTILPEVANGPEKPQSADAATSAAYCKQKKTEKQILRQKPNEGTGKCKRKRSNMIECEQLYAEMQAHFNKETEKDPPLLHTPHSLFEMLCASFEQEFPKCLPQSAVTEILLSLQQCS